MALHSTSIFALMQSLTASLGGPLAGEFLGLRGLICNLRCSLGTDLREADHALSGIPGCCPTHPIFKKGPVHARSSASIFTAVTTNFLNALGRYRSFSRSAALRLTAKSRSKRYNSRICTIGTACPGFSKASVRTPSTLRLNCHE